MVLAWKAGVAQATGGSNPPLSAIFYLSDEKRSSAALPSDRFNDVPLRYVLFGGPLGALHLNVFDQPSNCVMTVEIY